MPEPGVGEARQNKKTLRKGVVKRETQEKNEREVRGEEASLPLPM